MSCPFAHDDGAYVLDALPPAERLEFERHLPYCEDCARSVRQLAGLPGLLGRVDEKLLEEVSAADESLPDTVLPTLTRTVRRVRRRRAAGLAAAAAAGAAALATAIVLPLTAGSDGEETAPVPPASSTAPAEGSRPMKPVGEVPVRASVTLEQVAWGTRLALDCTYDPGSVSYDLPPAVDYLLVVRTRDGRTERVGSWRSVDGRPARLTAATAADTDEIASVQVRTLDGRVVLRLAT